MSATTGRRRHVGVGVALVLLAVLAAACGADEPSGVVGAPASTGPAIYPLPPPSVAPPSTAADAPGAVARFVRTADGVVLPDPVVTPGAVFDDVGPAEICELHYTQGVRQPRFNDKVAAFANYGVSIRDRDVYQVDHLVPISLGGSNAQENLWPQPYQEGGGAEEKDLLERQLRGLVCSEVITLEEAQTAIATDWWQAYATYMDLPVRPGTEGPEPWRRHDPQPGEVVNGGPCPVEGEVGYTEPKRVPLTCTADDVGQLRWAKRY